MSIAEHHRKLGAKVADWIIKTGPKRMVEIVAFTGRNTSFCEKAMNAANKDGRVTHVRHEGRQVIWCTLETRDAIHAEQKAKRAAYAAALYHRRVAAGVISTANMLVDPPDWEIEQRIIPAGTKPPPFTKAPNSVFALGGV